MVLVLNSARSLVTPTNCGKKEDLFYVLAVLCVDSLFFFVLRFIGLAVNNRLKIQENVSCSWGVYMSLSLDG